MTPLFQPALASLACCLLLALSGAGQMPPSETGKKEATPTTGPRTLPDDADDLKPLSRPGLHKNDKKDDSTNHNKDIRSTPQSRQPADLPPEDQPLTPRTAAPTPDKDRTQEILARLAQNLEAAEERLRQQDPGEQTRRLQEQIVKDLDELLKPPPPSRKNQNSQQASNAQSQNNPKDNSGGGQSGGSGQAGGGGGQSGGSGQAGGSAAGGGGSGGAPRSSSAGGGSSGGSRKSPAGGGAASQNAKSSGGAAGTEKSSSAGPASAGGGPAKEQKTGAASAGNKGQEPAVPTGKTGGAGGGQGDKQQNSPTTAGQQPKGQPPPKGSNLADVLRTEQDIWGHLPKTKRLEMDVYQRDRLPPQYENLLRQYYRAIAERRRQKGD
jgi:hypothetical protein